jgi:hypothetical protein
VPQARVKINGTDGSNLNLPIGVLVSLSNDNIGGETSYLWAILDQPAGPADNLSSTSSATPTFTPNKEGTYLIRLVVNGPPLSPSFENQVTAGILQIKTGTRVPAAGETVESSASEGWHGTALEQSLQLLDTMRADPMLVVGVAGSSVPTRGAVVYASGETTLKSGLPGQENVPTFDTALATSTSNMAQPLFVVEAAVLGGAISGGTIIYARRVGKFTGVTDAGAVGADMFVSNAGAMSSTPGANRRKIGSIIEAAAGVVDVMFDSSVYDAGAGGIFVHIAGAETITGQKTLAAGALVSTGQAVAGVAELNLDAATGQPINLQINNVTKAQLGATGGLAVGHTVDPGAGNLSISGAYEMETGGVNYVVARSIGGVLEFGDIGAIPGLTALEFLFAGSAIFAASPALTSLVPPSLYINGVLFAQSSGGNFFIGGGLGAGQSLALSGVGSTTSGIFFQFNSSTICGFRFSGATYDSSGAVLDLSADGVQGAGVIFANPASAKQSTFNILSATTVYPCDTQGGTVTVIANLPALASVPKGLTFYIYDQPGTATSTHPIQLSPHGTDSVRGANALFTLKIGSTYAYVGAIVTASATGWDVMLTQ